MRTIPFVQTSVFVDDDLPFGGNQLATFWNTSSNKDIRTEEMQGIALEMNFSESTFIEKPSMKGCSARIRIFTPGIELPFAGHPTLGTAYVMKHKGIVGKDTAKSLLELGIGPIPVEYLSDSRIQMTQPSPTFLDIVKDRSIIAKVIGLDPSDVLETTPVQIVTTGVPYIIVQLKDITSVKHAVPNPELITSELKNLASQEILIFSTETINKKNHVHVRMFAPGAGVLEDPATGSAAGPLAAFLERYNVLKGHEFGEPIRIEQGYEIKRPSSLIVEIPHESMDEILVSGEVRLTAEGTFFLQ